MKAHISLSLLIALAGATAQVYASDNSSAERAGRLATVKVSEDAE